MDSSETKPILVWDLPLRLFHWGLVAAIIVAVISVENNRMDIHERAGLTVLGLVLFRLVWGVFGGHHARFANFLVTPAATIRWIRATNTSGPRQVGHSPLASWSVLALLAAAGYLAMTGPMSNDGILYDGPLAHLVPALTGLITKMHHAGKVMLFPLILLHVLAILVYKFWKRTPLTRTMVTGRADPAPTGVQGLDGGISRQRAIIGLALIIGLQLAAHSLTLLRPAW